MSNKKNKNKFPVRKAIGAVLALSAGILYYTGISGGQETPPPQTFISTEENTDTDKPKSTEENADFVKSKSTEENTDTDKPASQKEIQTTDNAETRTERKDSEKAVVQNADVTVGLININTAEKDELCTLKGIGTSKADRIIEYREKNGGFKTIEEIMRVPGIKEGTFLKIKDCITV